MADDTSVIDGIKESASNAANSTTSAIKDSYNSEMNSTMSDSIKDALADYTPPIDPDTGEPTVDKDELEKQLNQVCEEQGNMTDSDTSELNSMLDDKMSTYGESVGKLAENTAQTQANYNEGTGPQDDYQTQDAVYGQEFPTTVPPITHFADVPNFPPANSEMTNNYPNQYGSMDESGNWFKIDKAEHSAEFVHASGTSLKVDKTGNVAVHIVGSLQIIVDKDAVLNILGNYDEGTTGNKSETVIGKKLGRLSSTEIQSGSSFSVTASRIDLN